RRDEIGRDAIRALLGERLGHVLDQREAAYPDADQRSGPVLDRSFGGEPDALHRLVGRRERELDEPIHGPELALRDDALGLEAPALARDLRRVVGGVEGLD